MLLPNVLIIGAMKAGTTSVYMDLAAHPRVFLADDKEPHALCDDQVLTPAGRQSYANLYSAAQSGQYIVDASTAYSKRPDFESVAKRAVQVLPEGFKVIYIVRHPIERIISQHHHEYTAGPVGINIDDEVRRHSRFVDYSRYAYQLEPWIGAVGLERIHVVRFEDYVDYREDVLEKLFRFLGLDRNPVARTESKVYNKTDGKPVRNRFWDVVFHSAFYRGAVRRILPPRLRLSLMQLLLPKGSLRPPEPKPETVDWLRSKLENDVQKLSELLELDEPFWPDFAPSTGSGTPSQLAANRSEHP